MKRLFAFAIVVTALIALPALVVPALGADEAAGPPTAVRPFPVLGGMGLTWSAPADDTPTGYEVERRRPSGNWAGESGRLDATTTRWIDRNLQPDTTVEYRVLAHYPDGQAHASEPVTAHRIAQDPVVGDTDMLMVDANRGEGATWLTDEVASPVSGSGTTDDSRTLSAGTIRIRMPATLPGPGSYSLTSAQADITQGDRSCASGGKLTVTDVAYTADLKLETMAATFDGSSCTGTYNGVSVEIRVKSARPYSAVQIDAYEVAYGQVRVGSTPAPRPIAIKNTGTEPLQLDKFQLDTFYSANWGPVSHNCPAELPIGQSCTATVPFTPQHTGDITARLVIGDSTSWGWHTVNLSGTGTSLPGSLDVYVSPTFNGHLVHWTSLAKAGGTKVRGYFLHRYTDGAETTRWVDPNPGDEVTVADANPQPGVSYAVSVVNEIGEGPTGARKVPERAADQLVLVTGQDGSDRKLMAADVSGRRVAFPTGTSEGTGSVEAVTTSPDGGSLAFVTYGYSTSGAEHSLWIRRVHPTEFGQPVKVWTSAVPVRQLAWSPEGSRIAFVAPEGSGDAEVPCVYVLSATGGTPQKIDCRLSSPSWMLDARTLAVVDHRFGSARAYVAQIDAQPGGSRVRTFNANPADGTPLRVSPDGGFIALGGSSRVTTITINGDMSNTSTDLGSRILSVTWKPDGNEILALTESGRLSRLTIGSNGTLTDPPPYDIWKSSTSTEKVYDVAWQGLSPMIDTTPDVTGPRISIPFDSSALLPGATTTCWLGGQQIKPCTSPATGTINASGTAKLSVRSEGPPGRSAVAVRTFTVDATGPETRITAPTHEAATAASVTVRYAGTDVSGVASYDVRYRRAAYNGTFGAFVQPWTGTKATSVSMGLAPGYEYCLSARARDKFGNLGGWSAEKCFARPMDDRALTTATTGWTRANWSVFYLGTATHTTKYGTSLTRTVQGKRFYLVATRCSTCGVVSVYLGSRYITAVDLRTTTTQRQVVIGLPAQASVFSGTLKITTRSTGKLVQIDGLGVRRT